MDLIYHFLAGSAIVLIMMLITKKRDDKTLLIGVALSLIAGLFKECVIDYWILRSTPDVADITLTLSGGLAVLFIVRFLEVVHILKK